MYIPTPNVYIVLKFEVNNLNETIKLSRKLANCCTQLKSSFVIYLIGELGVGKTALAQGFIQYFGFMLILTAAIGVFVALDTSKENVREDQISRFEGIVFFLILCLYLIIVL